MNDKSIEGITFGHHQPHPLAGQTATVNFGARGNISGFHDIRVEDWWDRLTGGSWMTAEGNPACVMYAIRSGLNNLPEDNDVLYGHDPQSHLGHLFHVTEIVAVADRTEP